MTGRRHRVACGAPGDQHEVTPASHDDAPQIADVLADAFTGYPWTDWIVPEHHRHDRLRALQLLSLTALALPHGSAWAARCTPTGPVVGGLAVLRPDRPVPPDVWAQVGEQQIELLGERAAAASAADQALDEVRPAGPVLVVATVGVARDHRRRGLARRLLRPALELADQLGVPAYLETSTAANVALYGAAGFTVTAHRRVPEAAPDVWAMARPPRASSTQPQVGQRTP